MQETLVRADAVTFGPFRLDLANRLLARAGTEVPLPPRAMGVLWVLASRAGEVVSKQDLLDEVWKDAFVSDTSLAEAVSLVRQVLGDDAQQPVYIQTLPRRGYRFIADVLPAERDRRSDTPRLGTSLETAPEAPLWTPWLPYLLLFVAGVAVGLGVMARARPAPVPPRGIVRFALDLGGRTVDAIGRPIAVTRRGDTIAVVLRDGRGVDTLALRALVSPELRTVPDSDGAASPFFSPDGRSVAFFAHGRLLRAPVHGGVPSPVADAPMALGGTWTDDDTIVFASRWTGGLQVVPATGGSARTLTTPDVSLGELRHAWPDAIDGTSRVLFTAARSVGGADPGRPAVVDLRSGEIRRLDGHATDARPLSIGHLMLAGPDGTSVAPVDARWDLVTGSSLVLPDAVSIDPASGAAAIAVAATGVRVSIDGPAPRAPASWIAGASGAASPASAGLEGLEDLAVDRAGRRVAGIERHGSRADLWIVDLARGVRSRAASAPALASPAWSPDGEHLAFAQSEGRTFRALVVSANGEGPPSAALPGTNVFPSDWHPSGAALLVTQLGERGLTVRVVPESAWAPGRPRSAAFAPDAVAGGAGERGDATSLIPPVAGPGADNGNAALSPDGRWLAWETNESGRWVIAVRAAASAAPIVVVADGRQPAWIDARTLVYLDRARLVRVRSRDAATFDPEPPSVLAEGVWSLARGATLDGRLLAQTGRITSTPSVTLEWFDDVRERLEAVQPLPRSIR